MTESIARTLLKMVQRAKEQRAIACNHLREAERQYLVNEFRNTEDQLIAMRRVRECRKRAELCTKHLVDLQIMQSEEIGTTPKLLQPQAGC